MKLRIEDITALENTVRKYKNGWYEGIEIKAYNEADAKKLIAYAESRWPNINWYCSWLDFGEL
jgi:hypothetical protein